MFDIDGDGYITQDELQYVFKQNMNHDPSRQFIEEIMQDIDKNNDNQISFDEFREGLTSMLGLAGGAQDDKISEKTTEDAV